MVVYVVLIGEDLHVYGAENKVTAHILHAIGADMWRMDADAWARERPGFEAMGANVTDHREEIIP